jgi:hypothetical protein
MRAYVGFRLGDSGAGKGHTAWTRLNAKAPGGGICALDLELPR